MEAIKIWDLLLFFLCVALWFYLIGVVLKYVFYLMIDILCALWDVISWVGKKWWRLMQTTCQ